MFRSFVSGIGFSLCSLCIVQVNASDAYYAEDGYRVDGGVVVQVLGSTPVEEAQVIQGQPTRLTKTYDDDDSE